MSDPDDQSGDLNAGWDVGIIGGGPAGLAAAYAAASAGARTVVLERAEHPRYKTCGGGLVGASLAAIPGQIRVPAHDHIHAATFTRNGRREFTRHHGRTPLVAMVRREEFDDALRAAAVGAGAHLMQRCPVRSIVQDGRRPRARLADGSVLAARVLVGADGSSGVSGRHVGVCFDQVDLGLEVELPVPATTAQQWRGRLLIDWGPIPGSYGWVFPKGDRLTVGVIASRGRGAETREYLRHFLDRLGLAGIEPAHDSGHLTRCRSADSPLRRGQVIVAGDAAGLLEPWTREGISFALRSGTLAGTAAAAAAASASAELLGENLDRYVQTINETLVPDMTAGRRMLAAFARHPGLFHAALATSPGWRLFTRFCRGELAFGSTVNRLPVRAAIAALTRS